MSNVSANLQALLYEATIQHNGGEMADKIEFKIEEDGTISTSTDQVSPTVHRNADEFLRYVKTLGGGAVKVTKKVQHGHQHTQVKAGR